MDKTSNDQRLNEGKPQQHNFFIWGSDDMLWGFVYGGCDIKALKTANVSFPG